MSFDSTQIQFDERGLIPAIVQDARTGAVLTLAYMNAESLQKIRPDKLPTRGRQVRRVQTPAFDRKRIVTCAATERLPGTERDRLNARLRFNPLAQLAIEVRYLIRLAIHSRGKIYLHADKILSYKTRIDTLELKQTLDEQSRADEQQQRERNFRHHEYIRPSARPIATA